MRTLVVIIESLSSLFSRIKGKSKSERLKIVGEYILIRIFIIAAGVGIIHLFNLMFEEWLNNSHL